VCCFPQMGGSIGKTQNWEGIMETLVFDRGKPNLQPRQERPINFNQWRSIENWGIPTDECALEFKRISSERDRNPLSDGNIGS
jgi:hypothetical protein